MIGILILLSQSLKIQINGNEPATVSSIHEAVKANHVAPYGVYKIFIIDGELPASDLFHEGKGIISIYPNTEEFVMYETAQISNKEIPAQAFKKSVLKKLVLRGVKKIGKEAFYANSYLESIDISTVEEIEPFAFSKCQFLKEIKLGKLKVLGSKSFQDCYVLDKFIIPPTVTKLEKSVFHGCHELKYLEIRATITEIPEEFFFGMRKLDTIILPSSVKQIENHFIESVNITVAKPGDFCPEGEIEIPLYARHIGTSAYANCTKITKLFIHKDVKTIGHYSFSGLDSLVDVTFEEPSSLCYIHNEAFSNCKSLATIKLPKNLVSIGEYIFKHSWALRTIYVHEKFDLEWHCEGLNSETHAKVIELHDPIPTFAPDHKFKYTPVPTRPPQKPPISEKPKFTKKRENIIFYFSDQQRWDSIGPNGQKLDITPYLDQLAREGVNYRNCFSPDPLCGPLRAAIQTSLYPSITGCFKNGIPLPLGISTIPRELKNVGYHLAYIGKWHLASDNDKQHYEDIAIPLQFRGGWDEYWVASDILPRTSHGYGGYMFDAGMNKRDFTGYRTDCVTDFALEYIRNYEEEEPFFLFISHIEPHHQNDSGRIEGPEGSQEMFRNFEPEPDFIKGKGDWEKWYPDYLGCVYALDKNLGRMIDALKDKGIYDDTMIVFTSDHGNHFKVRNDVEPGGGDDYKRNAYEQSIHIPLVIKGRDFYGGKNEDTFVTSLDFGPTFCRVGGAETPSHWQGRPLQELDRNDKKWENVVYIQVSEAFVGRAIRTTEWNYVIHVKGKNPYKHPGSDADEWTDKHLFDLVNDPVELHDLKDDPKYNDIKKELREILKRKAFEFGEGNFTIVDTPKSEEL